MVFKFHRNWYVLLLEILFFDRHDRLLHDRIIRIFFCSKVFFRIAIIFFPVVFSTCSEIAETHELFDVTVPSTESSCQKKIVIFPTSFFYYIISHEDEISHPAIVSPNVRWNLPNLLESQFGRGNHGKPSNCLLSSNLEFEIGRGKLIEGI